MGTMAATVVLVIVCASGWAYHSWRLLRKSRLALQHALRLRADERQGRIRAEKQLSELMQRSGVAASSSSSSRTQADNIAFRIIGSVESCFKKRQGTPRQSGLVDEARAIVHLDARVIPVTAVEGLEEFSHVWILYAFHQNTNFHKPCTSIKGKIQVPRLNGEKRGVFATRSPHRPNAIGLSMGRILEIRDKHTLLVGAADVVDGSPILDIKPLVPFCDCPADAWAPSWVDAAPVGDPLRVDAVSFTDSASRRLEEVWMASSSSLFKSAQDLEGAVKSCLSRDVRSLNQRQQGRSDGVYTLEMDCVKVEYTRSATRTSLVIDASAL